MKIVKYLSLIDERGMREGIKTHSGTSGVHHVDTADNGTLGIELGSFKEYDLYFIDLKMPDIEGTQVLREIKIMLSGSDLHNCNSFLHRLKTAVTTTRLGAYQYIFQALYSGRTKIFWLTALWNADGTFLKLAD